MKDPARSAGREGASWLAELARARAWRAEQVAAWARASERDAGLVAGQRAWIDELARSIAWHEEELARARAFLAGRTASARERAPAAGAVPARLGPLVSIVTPFYQGGARLAETADSVLAQTLAGWEWILVNDGSTDPASLAELERIATLDPRIRVLDLPENRGAGAARNAGYAAARAPYVLQLDCDDRLEPTAAEKWLWYLHTHPEAGFVNGHTICHGAIESVWTLGFEQAERFLERNFVGGRGMVRKAVHAAAGGYDTELPLALEDWDFWLRCADAGHWGATLDEALDWQHRRGTDAEQWADWDGGARQEAARAMMRSRHAGLLARGLPKLAPRWPQPNEPLELAPPGANPRASGRPRLVLIVAWLAMGGTDRFNLELVEQLVGRGWDVTVVTTLPSADEWRDEYRRLTADLFMLHRFLEPRDHPRFLRYLLESRRPRAVLVSHSELAYRLLPALRAWCPEPVYLDYLHILEPTWKSGGYPRMSALAHDQLDRTLVSSDGLRDWLVDAGAEPDRVEVVRTGIDVERFRPDPARRAAARARLGVEPGRPVLLFSGRLCEQKRPLLLPRTVEKLVAGGLDPLLLVAGDGELRDALATEVAERGLGERIRLLGALDAGALADALAAADLFFLPSEREGISLALLEAMACGLAVVATDVGGQRELVSEATGVLVEAGDDEAAVDRFAAAIDRLCRAPERRAALGAAARERVVGSWSRDELGRSAIEAVARAESLAARAPRRLASAADAARCAHETVEYRRLEQVCDWLWRRHLEREREAERPVPETAAREPVPAAAPAPLAPSARPRTAGALLFALLKRASEPVYVWGIRNGWRWLVPIKERVKSRMLRAPATG